jgi:hypothetical protein
MLQAHHHEKELQARIAQLLNNTTKQKMTQPKLGPQVREESRIFKESCYIFATY